MTTKKIKAALAFDRLMAEHFTERNPGAGGCSCDWCVVWAVLNPKPKLEKYKVGSRVKVNVCDDPPLLGTVFRVNSRNVYVKLDDGDCVHICGRSELSLLNPKPAKRKKKENVYPVGPVDAGFNTGFVPYP